jgi:hypothetical protein
MAFTSLVSAPFHLFERAVYAAHTYLGDNSVKLLGVKCYAYAPTDCADYVAILHLLSGCFFWPAQSYDLCCVSGLPGGPCTPSMYGLPPTAAAMAAAAAAAGSAAHSPSSAAAAAMYGFPPPSSPHASHLSAHHPFYTSPDLPPWYVH